jgi:NADH-quinone oxidoreductase subunit G/NADP-reducing hydrogenase subunit HndD
MSYKVRINGNEFSFEGEPGKKTILEACKEIGLDIPTFCYHERLRPRGACRLCIVEIESKDGSPGKLVTSCSTPLKEGMSILTHSQRVLNARRFNLMLLLGDHQSECIYCDKNTDCKLLEYGPEFQLSSTPFEHIPLPRSKFHSSGLDNSTPSIVKNYDKCIKCGLCVQICSEMQGLDAIGYRNRGAYFEVGPAFNFNLAQTECSQCGQCVLHCPTCALEEKSDIEGVMKALNDKKTITVAQIAPSVRVSIGEDFMLPPGEILTGQLVSALKRMGFDYVFDTQLGADLTIMEEAKELMDRVTMQKPLPMFTSCCPAWVKMLEDLYPELIPHLSTCRSPAQMLASVIKNVFAKNRGLNPKRIKVVEIMPCTAKKFEAQRPEYKDDVSFVLTTRETARMIKEVGLELTRLEPAEFDNPLGESSGAGTIFGVSGGVMEAALRTAYETTTNKKLEKVEFDELRDYANRKAGRITIKGRELRYISINTLGETRKFLASLKDKMLEGKSDYDFIEIMACPFGCIGGGGQPIPTNDEILKKRASAIYNIDAHKKVRRSYENPDIKKLYSEFFGEPGSKKAEELLHTKYYHRELYK